MAKNEELGLELVTLLNTKEKLQHDKEAVELEKMQVNISNDALLWFTIRLQILMSAYVEIPG